MTKILCTLLTCLRESEDGVLQAFTLVRALYELWRYVASYFTVKQIINGNTSQLVETQRYYMRAKEASIYDVRTEGGGGLARG